MTNNDKIRDEKLQYDSNREAAKISELLSGKIDESEFHTGEEILRKLNIKEKNQLNQMNLLKKDLNIDIWRQYTPLKRKIFNELVEERSFEFKDLEKRINPDNLIHKYKTEGISPKDFRNSQSLIELFKDLRDGNTDPKEALKDQINSKSGLGEINKGNKQSKSEDQISVIQNPKKVLDLREKIIDFFRDYSFFLSEAKYKAKYGKNIWESSSDLKNFRSTPFPFHSVGMGMHFCHKCPLLQLSQH